MDTYNSSNDDDDDDDPTYVFPVKSEAIITSDNIVRNIGLSLMSYLGFPRF
jgi:hypothetical protein